MLGTTVGSLTITRQVGEGGMGAVYLAEHRVLKTLHVLKVLLPQWTQDASIVQRFVNEARAAAAIQHRNIIRVQDCAQLPNGHWFIVMDYLDGGTLARYAASQGGPLAPPLILHIVAQIGNGLTEAHECGIVHRDLKPENIFLTTRDGNPHHVTILDFGIAKLGEGEGTPATRTGQMAGTPAYMAPEQMRSLKSVDPRTDVYALGVIAYQLATGGWLPFQDGDTPSAYYELSAAEIYHRQLTTMPIDPRRRAPSLSEAWANTILAALHPDPSRRPQSAKQFVLMLAQATEGDDFWPTGIEIVRNHARELLDIGNLQETVRSPKGTNGRGAIASRYQFGLRLGEGGMAEVFRGTIVGVEGFTREVAIKRVLPGFSTMSPFATMFVQEARIASQLVHPNIVQIIDFDRDAEDRLFLVMELVEGRDLDALRGTGPIPPSVIIFVVTEILRGLGYAHDLPAPRDGIRGIVHRDVSPHNVLLSWEGAVKVSDFGIAKARQATAATASTTIKGKVGYMSPEQANGEELDGRSDLFAVGVMLWEMLACQPLFVGTTQATIAQVFFRPIPRPSTLHAGVPSDLETIAMRLLERDRSARYATAEQVIVDLARCQDLPRDGRGELVRLLAQRFASDISDRASGRISQKPTTRPSVVTASARPAHDAWQPSPTPTTLGASAAQSVAPTPPRNKRNVVLGSVVAAGIALGLALALPASNEARSHKPREPATSPPSPPDAASVVRVTIETVPAGAHIEIDGQRRGVSPFGLAISQGARFEVVASFAGYLDTAKAATAEHDGQVIALALSPDVTVAVDAGVDAPAVMTDRSSKHPSSTTSPKSKDDPKAGSSRFDPNGVGGD